MRRWSELSRVERVGLYTRQSLYLMIWGFNAFVLLAAVAEADDLAVLVGGGLVVTALAFWAELTMLRHGDVPWRRIALLGVASTAYVAFADAAWTGTERGSALIVAVASVSLVLTLIPGTRIAIAVVLASGLLCGISG